MKVLIPSLGEDIASDIDEHFSKAKYFIFIDIEQDAWEVFENEYRNLEHAAEKVIEKAKDLQVSKLIVQSISEHAFEICKNNNIEVYYYEEGPIKIAIDKLKREELSQLVAGNKKKGKIFKED